MQLQQGEQVREQSEEVPSERDGAAVFRWAGECFAVLLARVREVLPMAALSRPPGAPACLEGFVILEGEAIPVMRLDPLLGRSGPERVRASHQLLVLRADPFDFALWVENVEDVLPSGDWPESRLEPAWSFQGLAQGCFEWNGERVHLLEVDELLHATERIRVDDFRRLELRRRESSEGDAP